VDASKKSTVPEGCVTPLAPARVAVKVTVWLKFDGLMSETSPIVGVALFTT
jgi:hypothetical protein